MYFSFVHSFVFIIPFLYKSNAAVKIVSIVFLGKSLVAFTLKIFILNLQYYSISNVIIQKTDTLPADTLALVLTDFKGNFRFSDRKKFEAWLKNRLDVDTLKLIIP